MSATHQRKNTVSVSLIKSFMFFQCCQYEYLTFISNFILFISHAASCGDPLDSAASVDGYDLSLIILFHYDRSGHHAASCRVPLDFAGFW